MIIILAPLNGCNDILCVKVSEACFDRSMHDLLHTSTSCHFKICLKSHTTGTTAGRDPTAAFGAQFYSKHLQKMERGIVIQQPNVLGRSSLIQRSFSHQPSSDFRPVRPCRLRHQLCPDRGNDSRQLRMLARS